MTRRSALDHLRELAVAAAYWLEADENTDQNEEGARAMQAAMEWAEREGVRRELAKRRKTLKVDQRAGR